jgi:hypothetical protein
MDWNYENGLELSYFLERLGMTPRRTVAMVRPYFVEDTRRLDRFTPSKWDDWSQLHEHQVREI